MTCNTRLLPRLIFPFGVAYMFMWTLSVLLLVPYYSSAEFDYSFYSGLPFMAKVGSELSEHYLTLPVFFIALAFLFPLVSIFVLLSAWASLKISEMVKIRFIFQPLRTAAMMLTLASSIPLVWIVRELVVVEGPTVQRWLTNTVPLLASYAQAGEGFVNSFVASSKGWMANYGPIGLFTAMIIVSVFSPIPNEVILAFAGAAMNPMNVAVFGALGSTVGGMLCFYITRLGGRPLAERFVKRRTMVSVDGFFAKWGSWTVMLGRLIPFVPFDAVSYFSGLTKMSASKFAVLTLLGSIPRCLFYAYVGESILEYNLPVLVALAITTILVFIIFNLKARALS